MLATACYSVLEATSSFLLSTGSSPGDEFGHKSLWGVLVHVDGFKELDRDIHYYGEKHKAKSVVQLGIPVVSQIQMTIHQLCMFPLVFDHRCGK